MKVFNSFPHNYQKIVMIQHGFHHQQKKKLCSLYLQYKVVLIDGIN